MDSGDSTPDIDLIAQAEGVSEWGAPMNYDGALPTESVIWVERLTDITDDGWDRIFQTQQINWVIIPLRYDNGD